MRPGISNHFFHIRSILGWFGRGVFALGVTATLISFESSAAPEPLLNEPPTKASLPEKLGKDAHQYLMSLPGQEVSWPLVLGRAIQVSDQFQMVKTILIEQKALEFGGQAPYDWMIGAGIQYQDQQLEPGAGFALSRQQGTVYNLGVSRYFSSGTQFSLGLVASSMLMEFPDIGGGLPGFGNIQIFPEEAHEVRGELRLSQNLWQDAFGLRSRALLSETKARTEAVQYQFQQSVEEFVIQLNELFYGAWLAQARVLTAYRELARSRRLLNITRIQLRRGTVERPDFLQIQNMVTGAETELSNAQQSLSDIWRALAISLKLPESWLALDPAYIPLRLDQPVGQAKLLCGTREQPAKSPESTAEIARLEAELRAARHAVRAAENLAAPELRAEMSYLQNGVDPESYTPAWNDFQAAQGTGWTAGLQFSLPLERNGAKANIASARARLMRAEAALSSARSDTRIEWINSCQDLYRSETIQEQWKEASEQQAQRVQLEERRFEYGRTAALNVTMAQADASRALFAYKQSLVQERQAAWKVIRMAGAIPNQIENLKKEGSSEQAD